MRLTRTLTALALAVAVAPAAGAQQVTDRSQVGSSSTITWTGATVGTTTASQTGAGVTVDAGTNGNFSPLIAGSSWQGGFTNGDALLYAGGGSWVELSFSSMLDGFATQLWHNLGTYAVTFEAFRGTSSIFSYILNASGGGAPNDNQAPVFGLVDAGGFDRVRITSSAEFSIDELTISQGGRVPDPTTVPEPATVALLGTGLLGMAAVRLRRRKQG